MCLLLLKHLSFSTVRPEYLHGTLHNVWHWITYHKNFSTKDSVVWHEFKYIYISYQHLKTQKHSVCLGLSCSGFSFNEHFNRQFTYAVFYIFKTGRCVWVKRFYTNTLLFFLPCLGQFLLWKHFIYSTKNLHSTKNIKKI